MIKTQNHDDGTPGMDIFATVFAVFVIIAATAMLMMGGYKIEKDRRYLEVSYYLKTTEALTNKNEFERMGRLEVVFPDNQISIVTDSGGRVAGGRIPSLVLHQSDAPGLTAIYREGLERGTYKLRFRVQQQDKWKSVFGDGVGAPAYNQAVELCLDVRHPLQEQAPVCPDGSPLPCCRTVNPGDPATDFYDELAFTLRTAT